MADSLKLHYKTVLFIALVLTIVETINLLTGRWLNQFSLIPRNLEHFFYIFTSPLLHANFAHFVANFIPLLVLSFLLMQFGFKHYQRVTLLLFLITGILVWMFAREARHIGASGILYGYFGYLLLAGFLSKRLGLAFISLFVVVFYGGMIWGILPTGPLISWESHLFGFGSGLCLAWLYRKKRAPS